MSRNEEVFPILSGLMYVKTYCVIQTTVIKRYPNMYRVLAGKEITNWEVVFKQWDGVAISVWTV